MPRMTVRVPVSVELSDDELETALDVAGVVVRDPKVRAAARRVGRLVDAWRRRRRSPR